MSLKRERQITRLLLGFATLLIAGLCSLLFQTTKRHGELLLELENQPERPQAQDVVAPPPDRNAKLMERGLPAGSICTNFDLPSLDGARYSLTQFRGRRTLLIFISPDCPQSASLLQELAKLPSPTPDDFQIVLISSGDPAPNRLLAERTGVRFPLLLQTHREVADAYFAPETPMAYLVGIESLTEIDRIEGAQAILGVAFAAISGAQAVPVASRTALPPAPNEADQPLHAGDLVPPFSAERPGLAPLTQRDLHGQRTLVYMFDPFCAPCVELLPDFARVHADQQQPNVMMISRRDPLETDALVAKLSLPFPIGYQTNREISHAIGARVFPAAFIVGPTLRLETEIAVGRRTISDLHRSLREERRGTENRRLVSLAALLQRP
jgi:peroxiredoxin